MTKLNKFDHLVENLSAEFSKIPNFNLLQKDGVGKILFNFSIQRISEIHSLKSLLINYYLPAASKAVANDLDEINKSKHKHLITLSKEDLKENYYETVRLGYIAIYHKYENYIKDLVEKAELLIADVSENNITLSQYIKEKFDFDFTDKKYSPTLDKIGYISNCNKHYDGYPKKNNKPIDFQGLPENEKLKFTKENLNRDIEFIIDLYSRTLNTIFILALHKMIHEVVLVDLEDITDESEKEKIALHRKAIDDNAKKLIDLLKSI